MKASKRIFSAAAALALLAAMPACGALTFPAHANSAPAYWRGATASGATALEKNCPIEVEREDLTLTLPELPASYYATAEEFLGYGANVEAAYTFYNPTDEAVDVTLAFPFGERPDYVYGYNYNEEDKFDDTARYTVTADGEEVARDVRYVYRSYDRDGFHTVLTNVASDEKIEDDFYSPDLVCHTHVVDATLKNTGEEQGYLSVMLSYSPQRTRILFGGNAVYTWGVREGEYQILYRMDGGLTAAFYSLGEEPQITAAVYSTDAAFKAVRTPLCAAEISDGETTTFGALLEAKRPAFIGENNYYNLIVADYFQMSDNFGALDVLPLSFREEELSRVYVYSLHIPAHGRVLNTVKAPLYPDIESRTYLYRYLLSRSSANFI